HPAIRQVRQVRQALAVTPGRELQRLQDRLVVLMLVLQNEVVYEAVANERVTAVEFDFFQQSQRATPYLSQVRGGAGAVQELAPATHQTRCLDRVVGVQQLLVDGRRAR